MRTSRKQSILISLAKVYADKIFAGEKRVELRRRPMRIDPGTTVWIYVKLPVGSIVGRARIEAIHESSPESLWRRFGAVSGLTREEFFGYFEGVTKGVALVLAKATRLKSALSLDALRRVAKNFQPPQFFLELKYDHPLFVAVTREAPA
jgi:predicted transcriptional regulator